MSVVVWVLGVGPDVVLDERREGGLRQVLVTVDAGIDQQVHVVGLSARLVADRSWPPRLPDAARCAGCANHLG